MIADYGGLRIQAGGDLAGPEAVLRLLAVEISDACAHGYRFLIGGHQGSVSGSTERHRSRPMSNESGPPSPMDHGLGVLKALGAPATSCLEFQMATQSRGSWEINHGDKGLSRVAAPCAIHLHAIDGSLSQGAAQASSDTRLVAGSR